MSKRLAELTTDQLVAETQAWLSAHLPAGWMEAVDEPDGDRLATLRGGLDYGAWCGRIGRDGYATPTWPAEYGAGLSLTSAQARVVDDILTHYQVPRPFNVLGIGMGAPTVMVWGTEEQKQRWLPKIPTNEEIWCQLFSEPGAGSDLASLSTRAVRDGDEWVLNGQKVWTTLGHIAQKGMLLARTNADVPKHKGLTYFVVDMDTSGIDVRPLVQMTGEAEFNEVFFVDARIPDSARLGPEGGGWAVALTTLMNERFAASGAGSLVGGSIGGTSVGMLIERHRPTRDPVMRQRLAAAYVTDQIIRWNNRRAAAQLRSGQEAGPEGSITKLQQAIHNQELQNLAVDLEGAAGMAWEGPGLRNPRTVERIAERDDSAAGIVRGFLRAQANSIEGGTSNIMRNILGERVLRLPKEPDPWHGRAWSDLPRTV
jgi:alkylation response protein AidB-like acyl-CoA dehydrogenase